MGFKSLNSHLYMTTSIVSLFYQPSFSVYTTENDTYSERYFFKKPIVIVNYTRIKIILSIQPCNCRMMCTTCTVLVMLDMQAKYALICMHPI